MDGSLVTTSVMQLLPTSRGNITMASVDPADPPVIDPNHLDTASDRVVLIHGMHRLMQALLDTKAGKGFVETEFVPPSFTPLTSQASDEEIEARIRATGAAHYHSAGSAAMGLVVDSQPRVYCVEGLRIADASVIPVPIGGHPQATLYALGEKTADLILEGK